MADNQRATGDRPSDLDVVALLVDRPRQGLARGQVGTVVEPLDDVTVLVEFSDDEGRAYALAPSALGASRPALWAAGSVTFPLNAVANMQ